MTQSNVEMTSLLEAGLWLECCPKIINPLHGATHSLTRGESNYLISLPDVVRVSKLTTSFNKNINLVDQQSNVGINNNNDNNNNKYNSPTNSKTILNTKDSLNVKHGPLELDK